MKRILKIAAIILTIPIILVLVLAAISCIDYPAMPEEFLQVLRKAKTATLYSLEPPRPFNQGKQPALQGFYILGETHLADENLRRASYLFQHDVRKYFFREIAAMCFSPRHAMRIISEGHTYDFIICYSCGEIHIYKDDVKIYQQLVRGSPEILNQILTEAKVPLSSF